MLICAFAKKCWFVHFQNQIQTFLNDQKSLTICLYCITWQLSVTCPQVHHHNAVCDSFTAPHIYFPVVVMCFFPADAIFHEKRQHNWVPSHFISVPCQGASVHDININLFLYSCTVQPSLLSEMLTLHIAFWIMKSSCHASQVDCEVIWALCSRTKRCTRLHKILFFTYWNMKNAIQASDVLSLFLNVIQETDSSESKFSFSRQWNLLLLLFQQQ